MVFFPWLETAPAAPLLKPKATIQVLFALMAMRRALVKWWFCGFAQLYGID